MPLAFLGVNVHSILYANVFEFCLNQILPWGSLIALIVQTLGRLFEQLQLAIA